MILIISNRGDVTTDLVVKRMRQRSVKFTRFNTERFPCETKCTLSVLPNGGDVTIETPKQTIHAGEVDSVWYRRPMAPDWGSTNLLHEDRQFAEREALSFLRSVWTLLESVFWLDDPFVLARAEQKAYQLRTANTIGLKTPETLFSNNIEHILSFAKQVDGKIIETCKSWCLWEIRHYADIRKRSGRFAFAYEGRRCASLSADHSTQS